MQLPPVIWEQRCYWCHPLIISHSCFQYPAFYGAHFHLLCARICVHLFVQIWIVQTHLHICVCVCVLVSLHCVCSCLCKYLSWLPVLWCRPVWPLGLLYSGCTDAAPAHIKRWKINNVSEYEAAGLRPGLWWGRLRSQLCVCAIPTRGTKLILENYSKRCYTHFWFLLPGFYS